jgi:hypothetical protein
VINYEQISYVKLRRLNNGLRGRGTELRLRPVLNMVRIHLEVVCTKLRHYKMSIYDMTLSRSPNVWIRIHHCPSSLLGVLIKLL